LYFMNKWGKVFEEAFASGELDFPIITGISPKDAFHERQLVCAAEVLRILETEDRPLSLADLSEIHVREDGNVHLYFSSLPVIRIKGNLLDKRMDDLKKVVDHLFNTGRMHLVRGINLNYQDGAVVSFKKG
ncbi:MAG: cell division protein FtsQ, partial [Deltaproteobacteria bacterium]|nr:cell division protein FtsQ [Deltaproteobacteria bacterium]